MKVIQCDKGHFYDSEKYDECPVCKKIAKKEVTKTEKIEPINDLDLSALKECEEVTQIHNNDTNLSEPHTMKPTNPLNVESVISREEKEIARPSDDGETQVSFWGDLASEPVTPIVQEEIKAPEDDAMTQVLGGFALREEKIVPNVKTKHNGPVVGWLVAVQGPHKGQSFELYAKKNFIGRGSENIICLSNDKTVSRTSPLSVIFDNKKSDFIAMAGNSDQTAYVNDQLVLQPIVLKGHDKIILGNTTLLFIPLITSEYDFESTYMAGK